MFTFCLHVAGYFEKEIRKENLRTYTPDFNPEAPAPRDMIDLEVTYTLNCYSIHMSTRYIWVISSYHIKVEGILRKKPVFQKVYLGCFPYFAVKCFMCYEKINDHILNWHYNVTK